MTTPVRDSLVSDIRSLARPLASVADLDPIVTHARDRHVVAIGEASHGTHEFYDWRARLSRRLIEEQGFTWIGVEGDWPDCRRIDLWVRGLADQHLDARAVLAKFERWPTWMWANVEVADFLEWLREWNADRPTESKVGFYGLDVYSLWESLEAVLGWLEHNAPEAVPAAFRALECFAPYYDDPQRYAWDTRMVPVSCETDVVSLLVELRSKALEGDDGFDAEQNAIIAVEAERYYRAMVRTDRGSWNIRDIHMTDTIDRIGARHGAESRGIVWEHNTHVGDARATSMASEGLVNVGQLLRERRGEDDVLLVGFSSYRGDVIAGSQWGAPEQRMPVPPARAGSHEDLLNEAVEHPALFDLKQRHNTPWLGMPLGHRAIGVVYDPEREGGNYVPTVMGRRYDALLWLPSTVGLRPLRHEPVPTDAEYETEPSGF